MASRKPSINWMDALWVLSMGARGGLMIALPVLAGLIGGYLLDRRFGTLPWISLLLTAVGGFIGPVILYRWVTQAVAQREGKKRSGEKSE